MRRREFLSAGLTSTLGLALSPSLQRLAAADQSRRARACILVWLNGGPSHLDTFDPKPGLPVKAIDTTVPGLKLAEHFPKLAGQARHLAVVRSLTSPEGDHDRAFRLLHTGNLPDDTLPHPGLGSVVAAEVGAGSDLPAFVSIQGPSWGPGFLGAAFAPHSIGDVNAGPDHVALPEGVDEDRVRRRLRALGKLDAGFATRSDPARAAEFGGFTERAVRFRNSPALKAFDLKLEKPAVAALYGVPNEPPKEGENEDPGVPFAKGCLLARRLVENGVRFVEVMLDGWDTHENNFEQVQDLATRLDMPLAALLADLEQRGMLESTLVLCLGEFGRTPVVNASKGRDHHSAAFSALLAGGGVRGGQVIGSSDEKGDQVKDRPVRIPDLYATLLTAFGLDPAKTYRAAGRPVKLAEKGVVVKELFG